MQNIIEELFRGKIEPYFLSLNDGSNFFRAKNLFMDQIALLEKELKISHESRGENSEDRSSKLIEDIVAAHETTYDEGMSDSFVYGFRMGARFMLDTFLIAETLPGDSATLRSVLFDIYEMRAKSKKRAYQSATSAN